MARTIKVADELYRELGRYGNRDEPWNDVLARVLAHVNEESAIEDRNQRVTTYDSTDATPEALGPLAKLEDGTRVRHEYRRGDYGGDVIWATVQGDRLVVEGDNQDSRTPTGAARVKDKQHRGDDARGEGYNGWRWWEYESEDGDWVPLSTLKE